MNINFRQFKEADVPLFYKWADKMHVKEKWFKEGYAPKESILKKLDSSSTTFPFIICLDEENIGYIQYYFMNEDAYKIYKEEPQNTVGFDIFIGEEDYLHKGYGTKIVKEFSHMLFQQYAVSKIIVDPFIDDKRAIRCYENAGFKFYKEDKDDKGSKIYVMQRLKIID